MKAELTFEAACAALLPLIPEPHQAWVAAAAARARSPNPPALVPRQMFDAIALCESAAHRRLENLRFHLENEPSPAAALAIQDASGNIPFNLAAQYKNFENLAALALIGGNSGRDRFGRNALFYAASAGWIKGFELLLAAGIPPEQDLSGWNPLHAIIHLGFQGPSDGLLFCAEKLCALYPGLLSQTDADGASPLQACIAADEAPFFSGAKSSALLGLLRSHSERASLSASSCQGRPGPKRQGI